MSNKQKEIEKLREETIRSLHVALVKKAHELIEITEKERKCDAMFSIGVRILDHLETISTIMRSMNSLVEYIKINPYILHQVEVDPIVRKLLDPVIGLYKSIREDLKDTLKIGEKFEKYFPEIETEYKSWTELISILISIHKQEKQMLYYIIRFL